MPEHRPNREVQAAEIVSQIIRARRFRANHFGPALFSDSAWDVLLVLLVASIREAISADEIFPCLRQFAQVLKRALRK